MFAYIDNECHSIILVEIAQYCISRKSTAVELYQYIGELSVEG